MWSTLCSYHASRNLSNRDNLLWTCFSPIKHLNWSHLLPVIVALFSNQSLCQCALAVPPSQLLSNSCIIFLRLHPSCICSGRWPHPPIMSSASLSLLGPSATTLSLCARFVLSMHVADQSIICQLVLCFRLLLCTHFCAFMSIRTISIKLNVDRYLHFAQMFVFLGRLDFASDDLVEMC